MCKFSINTSSGIAWVPFLFNKPQLICNAIPLGELPSIHTGIILPKLITNSENQIILKIEDLLKIKILKLNEFNTRSSYKNPIIKYDATRFQSDFFYKEKKLKILDNTETEIHTATQELIDYNIKNKKLNSVQKKNQIKFKNAFPKNHPMRNTKAFISPSWLDKYINFLV